MCSSGNLAIILSKMLFSWIATGWRLGIIAIHENNIFDKMIAKPPARRAEVFRIRVDPDRVLRQLAEQGAEIVDERSVYVVGQQHQIRTFVLYQIRELADGLLAQRHAGGIARVDDEEGLDLRILEFLDFVIGELKAVFLRRRDMHDLEVVVLQMRHLEIRRK